MRKMSYLPSILLMLFVLLLFLAIPSMKASADQKTIPLNEQEAETILIEAYIYGYPLITMDMTRRVMTNIVVPEDHKAPMGQFFHSRTYPNASFHDVTAPNADTLYSTAWLDLSKEPYILHLPKEQDRYYLMPMLSGWTDVFANPGTRTTGIEAADYAVVGPSWKGSLPEGVKEFKSPTNMVWILGRTYCSGTPEDYKLVHAIQDQYTLTPLSFYKKTYKPPMGTFDSTIDMKTPVRTQVNNLEGVEYFKRLAQLMRDNPPAEADQAMVTKMEKVGIVPGKELDERVLTPRMKVLMEETPKNSLREIADYGKKMENEKEGWVYSLKTGTYGTDYMQRAFIAAVGLGANLPEDAVYPYTRVDEKGNPLNGSNRYVIHFERGETPPVNGFWSLTLYNDQFFFAENPLGRYTLSPRDDLKYNDDGSLDLYIQNGLPEGSKQSNWLPAPKGNFILMLRLYWPKEPILNGSWKPPVVKRV